MPAIRRSILAWTALAATVAGAAFVGYRVTTAADSTRAGMWDKVAQAESKGLPRTAIKELEPLIESAIKDKDYPEAIKAVVRKIALEGNIEGNKPEERVVRLKAAIDKLPKEMHPVLDAVLAHWTWHYYEQNRWRFLQRTTTAAPVGDDMTTWDLPRIMAEIDARFAKALANEKELKATPIGNYDKVIAKGSLSDEYRPTLFDFLVFDAIAFYAAAEQAGAKPQDAFEIEADGPALAPLAEFLKWEPKATDSDAPKLKVIKLLQNVLKFHEDDSKRTALLDADLLRLHLMSNLAVGPAKNGRYKLVLQEFAERNKDHELSALAQARFAQVLFNEGNRVEAKKVADAAIKAYPESVGGTTAYNLTQQILAKELSFNTERVWPGADALPPITVSYRNLNKVHFRAYKLDWDARVKSFAHQYNPDTNYVLTNERVVKVPKEQGGQDYLQFDHKAEWQEILKGKPTQAWESAVPETPDFNLRSEKVTTPKGFEPGFYMVFASADGEFREGQSPVYATGVWVSELALVMRHGEPDAPTGGMVVNARTGEPVEGAKVRVWTWVHHQKRNNVNHYWNERVEVEPTKTDKNGLFATTAKGNESYIVQASHNGQVVANGHDHSAWWGHGGRPGAHHQVVLFTDRTLYRPGQTVRYKGILINVGQSNDAYGTVANQNVSVTFNDPNGKMISTASAKTNDFGSFSGSFIAPRDRLTGQMTIYASGSGHGQTTVHVEEYKRPQFIVTLDTPKNPARLGETVTVSGKATAYTGSAVGGAKVLFRVSREVQYPRWWHDCYWWMPTPSSPAQEIIHGGAVTNPDGTFEVKFPATPDRTIPAEQEPTFSYKVTADVTHSPWGYQWGPGGWEFHQQWYPGRARNFDMLYAPAPGAMAFEGKARVDSVADLAEVNNERGDGARKLAAGKPADMNVGLDPELPSQGGAKPPAPAPNLDNVTARTNLNETAFFFPHLVSDDDGTVRMEFTMPEALTKWKFMAFAHDKTLRSGSLSGETVTAKDLMVQPNAPRFLRDGDVLEFTVKVSNQSETKQTGKVRLTFADARTGQPIDANLGNLETERTFDIAAKESKAFAWRLTVPVGLGPVIYKAVGATDKFSDGEENILPVLSSRVLVTESLPLPIRGKQTKTFDFQKLIDSGKSDTLKHQAYTVQMTSNPSWYAIMALPYLMEYPHECNEQTFSRMYANLVARHVVNSDKKIHAIFEQWRNTPGALDSPLEKNQDLKSVLLDETPWVRAATNESENRRRVGLLFDDNRLNDEIGRAQNKLAQAQLPNGKWPWFPGDVNGNEYITLYLTTGYGRLRHLGVKVDVNPGIRALNSLDAWANEMYRRILEQEKLGHTKRGDNHLSHTIAMWLYGRSFFLKDQGIAQANQEAVDYWQSQAKKYWLQLGDRQSQAHLAIALKRFGVKETPDDIMKSIKERSVSNEEMGMFWRDQEHAYYWYRAPIETQAVMIEAFDEVSNDQTAVEDCKVWLLKQKQTTAWHTTKATADAVYALLLKGNNPLKSDALVEVTVGGVKIEPEKVEAGTGFYEHKFVKSEVKPEMGKIEVKKTDDGVAWGGVHWQYLEDVTKVTPHDGTPLKLEKTVFKRVNTKKGPVLEPINGTVQVGDELIMRIVLRSDRNMEFIHLKDHRGSGTEPVNVMSKYKFQDGLGYYESTRDTCTNFFIDYLPKGTYVFEYPVRVVHRGKYPTGLASIQCMYAPEFNSHSASVTLEAK